MAAMTSSSQGGRESSDSIVSVCGALWVLRVLRASGGGQVGTWGESGCGGKVNLLPPLLYFALEFLRIIQVLVAQIWAVFSNWLWEPVCKVRGVQAVGRVKLVSP